MNRGYAALIAAATVLSGIACGPFSTGNAGRGPARAETSVVLSLNPRSQCVASDPLQLREFHQKTVTWHVLNKDCPGSYRVMFKNFAAKNADGTTAPPAETGGVLDQDPT